LSTSVLGGLVGDSISTGFFFNLLSLHKLTFEVDSEKHELRRPFGVQPEDFGGYLRHSQEIFRKRNGSN